MLQRLICMVRESSLIDRPFACSEISWSICWGLRRLFRAGGGEIGLVWSLTVVGTTKSWFESCPLRPTRRCRDDNGYVKNRWSEAGFETARFRLEAAMASRRNRRGIGRGGSLPGFFRGGRRGWQQLQLCPVQMCRSECLWGRWTGVVLIGGIERIVTTWNLSWLTSGPSACVLLP